MSRLRPPALVAAFALALAVTAVPCQAQEPVPADHAAALYRAALALESEQSYDLADALMEYILRHYPDSDAAAAIVRTRSQPGRRRLDTSGRTELVVWSTLYGLWLGVAVPGMLGAENAAAYGAGLLVGGPLGLGTAMTATRGRPVSDGTAAAITFGGTWGTWQGWGWADVLGSRRRCEPDSYSGGEWCYDDGPSAEAVLGSMIAGGVAGILVGSRIAGTHGITPGQASTTSLAAVWGIWYGYALSVLTGLDGSSDGALTAALVGGDLGLLIGAGIARRRHPTRSAARLVSIAGVAGGLAGLGLDLIVQPSSDGVAVGIPMATSALALAVAASAISSRPSSETGLRAGARGDWRIGGPVVPAFRRDDGGRLRPALAMTLLSGRF